MNLYVSNLGDQITDESLRAVFATHGTVTSSILSRESENVTGNTAVIQMPDPAAAGMAMRRIHGSILNGMAVTVQESGPACVTKH